MSRFLWILIASICGLFTDAVHSQATPAALPRSDSASLPFIYGGKIVKSGDAPWQAVVFFAASGPLAGLACGGTVISNSWILTAAHCFFNEYTCVRYPDYALTVGTSSRSLTKGMEPLEVASVVVHPEFSCGVWENDLALIKSKRPMALPPMALATLTDEQSPPAILNATGWGKTESGKVSDNLLFAQVPVIINSQCAMTPQYGQRITERLICAGKIGSDTCKGDSGGPLYLPMTNGDAIQFGVTVAGDGCGTNPGVYTRVSYFRKWIAEVLAKTPENLLDSAEIRRRESECTPERTKANLC